MSIEELINWTLTMIDEAKRLRNSGKVAALREILEILKRGNKT